MEGGKVVLINEVEHIVGLSKKSIRYYEKNGLLNPQRNSSNDYRIYSNDEVDTLKKIKFLRDLGVPIKDLKSLTLNKVSLRTCLEDQLAKIERETEKYETIKSMCVEIIEEKDEFDTISIEKYYRKMNVLGKEGFTLRDTKSNKTKKIVGAVLASAIYSLFFVFCLVIMFTQADIMPWPIFLFLAVAFGVPIIGIVYNLISRILEILGGEEDEASKY